MLYADVILPLPLFSTFSYSIPADLEKEVNVGSRVLVQFGKKKYYTGIIAGISEQPPGNFEVKPIMSLLDGSPALRYPQLKFWQWIADYYLCPIGDVYKAAIPSGLKPESETWITLNPDFEPEEGLHLTDYQNIILDILEDRKKIRLSDIESETKIKNVAGIVNRLLEMGIIEIAETINERYRPKSVRMLRLCATRGDKDKINSFFDLTSRSPMQEKVLITYLSMSKWLTPVNIQPDPISISREELTKKSGVSSSIIKSLINKGILEEYRETVDRFNPENFKASTPLSPLSLIQTETLRKIDELCRSYGVCLLHGITGSGKTEIYMHFINRMLEQNNQVLFLVPEISLTTQLTDRLRKVFGERLVVYHSKFSDAERVEIYKRLLSKTEPLLILGARSSVFLPFSNLRLVIVDEEHEASYKQYDPAPRYNARDAAIVLAQMHGAKTLLGSATPSIETYYKALNGKYGLVSLTERFEGSVLPDVEIVDMKAQRKKKLCSGIISSALKEVTSEALKNGRQAIMFQNRRGFAPVVVCKKCGWTPKCPNCDVSQVYHKYTDILRCHYCGFSMQRPALCPACGENSIEIYGYGTERIAEEVADAFPESKVARMDLDTTRNKNSYQQIIEQFSNHQTDILVGTQMVAKGLDFDKVDVVGVLNADTLLNFPDFRSNERAFNMIAQVAGRAGRRDHKGTVVVQTTNPDNEVLKRVREHNYTDYYASEITDRKKYCYPPFTRIINVYLKNKDSAIADAAAVKLATAMRNVFGNRVLGPEKPFVSRVATYYLQSIMLKIETESSMAKVKYILRNIYESLARDPLMRSSVIYYDVDPS